VVLAIILISFGLFSGLMAGLLGIGGGIVFLPLAKLYFLDYLGYDISFVKILIATSSAIIIINSSSSLYRHYKLKNIHFKLWPYLLFPTLIGTQIGGYFTKIAAPQYLKYILSLLLLLSAIKMMFFKQKQVETTEMSKKNKILLIVAVFIISIFASMLGIGGGAFMVPVLFMLSGLSFKRVAGTAPMFKFFVSVSSTIFYLISTTNISSVNGHIQIGYVDVTIWFYTAIGGMIGAQFGAILLNKIPAKVAKNIFIVLLFISAYKML